MAGINRHAGLLYLLHGVDQFSIERVVSLKETKGKLSIVLKQRLFPGSAEAALILAVGGAGQAAAVGGGAAGGIGDVHTVAKELGDHLHIGSLAAACAGRRELIIMGGELKTLDSLFIYCVLLDGHMVNGVSPVIALGEHGLGGHHGQGTILSETTGGTLAAAQAIVGRHLNAVLVLIQADTPCFHGFERLRCGSIFLFR